LPATTSSWSQEKRDSVLTEQWQLRREKEEDIANCRHMSSLLPQVRGRFIQPAYRSTIPTCSTPKPRGLDRPMRSLIVVGGGAVACEYASVYVALGAEVTLIDRGRRLLPFLDAECSVVAAECFKASGMKVLSETAVAAVTRDSEGLTVRTDNDAVLRPEKVIFAAGRVGNTEELGLAEIGVTVDERWRIRVDDQFQTTAPGVYAAGDVIGPPALASASMEQGRVAACYALGIPFKMSVGPLTPFGCIQYLSAPWSD
jgi:NAD(P) transhydrogenase